MALGRFPYYVRSGVRPDTTLPADRFGLQVQETGVTFQSDGVFTHVE